MVLAVGVRLMVMLLLLLVVMVDGGIGHAARTQVVHSGWTGLMEVLVLRRLD